MTNQVVKRRSVSRNRPTAKASNSKSSDWTVDSLFNEGVAVLFLLLAVFLLLSVASDEIWFGYGVGAIDSGELASSHNYMGRLGHVTGRVMAGLMGLCSLVPVVWSLWLAVFFYYHEGSEKKKASKSKWAKLSPVLGVFGVLAFACAVTSALGSLHAGGAIGATLAKTGVSIIGRPGATVLFAALFLISLALATQQTVADVLAIAVRALSITFTFVVGILPALCARAAVSTISFVKVGIEAFGRTLMPSRKGKREEKTEPELPKPRVRKNVVPLSEEVEQETLPDVDDDYSRVVVQRRVSDGKEAKREKQRTIVEDKEPIENEVEYERPLLGLLERGKPLENVEDDSELREKSRIIESKLRDFGIMGRVTHVHPGPVVTLFEFEPAAGVKVGKISTYGDDLAMALLATSIRIIAPIPKRGTVGIEVPNKLRDLVWLRDVLESEAFQSQESLLSVAVGKDTVGDPVVVDISKTPHLLMAGATGTGKSVCINTLLISLLYRAGPKDLGLILIDPKILELSVYEGIPHLKVPVVTNPRQAKAVLQWAVNEMNRRYRLLQKYGVRNIDGYNKVVSGETKPDDIPNRATGELPEEEDMSIPTAEEVKLDSSDPTAANDLKIGQQLVRLPKIVIVIDELADLMLAAGRDVEELITRLAQKARASGIHLVLATQRPSVDVITGLIKANFPTRMSFRVASKYDSRTILDSIGAEKLLGKGDMLFMQPGAEAVRRVHGAFISDEDVNRVVASIKAKAGPRYDKEIMEVCEKALAEENKESQEGQGGEEEYDSLYDAAVELVTAKGLASTSMIQRAFRIGYNRAARIMEIMEREGLVGKADGAKPREVIVRTGAEDTI